MLLKAILLIMSLPVNKKKVLLTLSSFCFQDGKLTSKERNRLLEEME